MSTVNQEGKRCARATAANKHGALRHNQKNPVSTKLVFIQDVMCTKFHTFSAGEQALSKVKVRRLSALSVGEQKTHS